MKFFMLHLHFLSWLKMSAFKMGHLKCWRTSSLAAEVTATKSPAPCSSRFTTILCIITNNNNMLPNWQIITDILNMILQLKALIMYFISDYYFVFYFLYLHELSLDLLPFVPVVGHGGHMQTQLRHWSQPTVKVYSENLRKTGRRLRSSYQL